MDKDLINLLAQGYTCVTPTQRLSRYLRYQFALTQIAREKTAWPTPDCLPWSAWVKRSWQELDSGTENSPLLINPVQQQWLWQQVIERSSYKNRLLQTISTARQAIAAYGLCKSYCIDVFPEQVYLNEDARAFQHWHAAYIAQLENKNLLDEAALPDALSKVINAENISNRKIIFYGFDMITPQQRKLIDGYKKFKTEVFEIDPAVKNENIQLHACLDTHQEIEHAANWCRELLQAEPGTRIGIVSPELHKSRNNFINQFDASLTPAALLSPTDEVDKPYNISLGQALGDYPLIHTALNILRLGQQQVSVHTLGTLLRSPFIGRAQSEFNARANFDACLREYGEVNLRLKTIFRISDHICKPWQQCKGFIERLKAFDIHYLSSARTQSPGAWAQTFSDLLKQFNWPGDRTLNSDEYQTMEAWQKALNQLATLEQVVQSISYAAALTQLTRICNDTSFQPQTSEAPIQILGEIGAAGMQFDHLWFIGCHDQVWPPVQQPNPFIPTSLQRDANIPAASAGLQLAYTQGLTDKLIHSANNTVISYPQQQEDRPLRPSPVIKIYAAEATALNLNIVPDYKHQCFAARQVETFIDDQAPAIPAGDPVSGGSGLFKDQALCPFKAFARYRLHAKGLKAVDSGLSKEQRGQLVHQVMQNLWLRIRDSETLNNYSLAQLAKTIEVTVDRSMKQFIKEQPDTFSERFSQIEAQRLRQLLEEWLIIEQGRHGFSIKETEQWHTVNFADIQIKMRIDRIDKLADGRLAIIDYKTGRVSIKDWLDDRPADPQLPLYAVTTDGEVAALLYARIKRGECKFEGLSAEENLIPNVYPVFESTWAEQTDKWHAILTQLAKDFREGKAVVSPRDDQSCRYCDLHSLCRIHEKKTFLSEMEAYE